MQVTYYHNPRCTKSRQGLELLEKSGLKFTVKKYLEDPLTKSELLKLMDLLKNDPNPIARKKESIVSELKLDLDVSNEALAELIIQHPILLERPIWVSDDDRATIGRPYERSEAFLAEIS